MLIEIQSRMQELLISSPAFSGVAVLTDARPDLVSAVAQALAKLGFVVIIGQAAGQAAQPESPAPLVREELHVTLVQGRLHTQHNPVTLAEHAIRALHRQPIAPGAGAPRLYFERHRTEITDDGLRIVELLFSTTVILQPD